MGSQQPRDVLSAFMRLKPPCDQRCANSVPAASSPEQAPVSTCGLKGVSVPVVSVRLWGRGHQGTRFPRALFCNAGLQAREAVLAGDENIHRLEAVFCVTDVGSGLHWLL